MNIIGEVEKRFGQVNSTVFRQVNRVTDWWNLPTPVALLNLRGLRDDLRDVEPARHQRAARTAGPTSTSTSCRSTAPTTARSRTRPIPRWAGSAPASAATPRATRHPEALPELLEPSPREVSERLLRRDTFKPAETLNVLAACWIQFENHDWFGHGENSPDEFIEVPLPDGDDWPDGSPMKVKATSPDRTRMNKSGLPPTYVNTVTHWWDGSQIYGSDEERNRELRSGVDGKLKVDGGHAPGGDRGEARRAST